MNSLVKSPLEVSLEVSLEESLEKSLVKALEKALVTALVTEVAKVLMKVNFCSTGDMGHSLTPCQHPIMQVMNAYVCRSSDYLQVNFSHGSRG